MFGTEQLELFNVINHMPKLTNPLMNRSSSKESLNDYFWDDLDETSGEQTDKSILSLFTKSRAIPDDDNKLKKGSGGNFVASQGLVQMRNNDTNDAGSAHVLGSAKGAIKTISESSSSSFDNTPLSGGEVSADNEGIAQKLDENSMGELLSGGGVSGRKEPVYEATSFFTQEHAVAEKKENEHRSSLSSTMEAERKIVGLSEDSNELPNSFWGNEEEGADFETKMSLLTLNAKSEEDSEYSSLLSKLSTEAFLCSMSEVLGSAQDAASLKESEQTQSSGLEKKGLARSTEPHDHNVANEPTLQEKGSRDSVGEETRENVVVLEKKMASENTDNKDVCNASSERETLIPKSGGRDLVSDDSGFNFGLYPRILYLQGRQLVAHPTKRKRLDINSGTEREFVSTFFTFFVLNYNLPSIVDLNCAQIVEREPILSILFSRDVTIDKIIDALDLKRIKYVVSDIGNSKGDANELVEMFFLNREVAIKHALESRQWALALFLSHNTRHQDEVIKEFSRHLNPILHPFFGCGEMTGNWKQTFSLLMRNPQDRLIDILISRTHGTELLFAVLSFYFIHSRKFSTRLFFNNFYFLKLALCYGIEPENLDILILRYLKVMQEGGKDDVSKVYNKYKGRKGVSQWEPKRSWLEGIKSAVEKGISRIVGADEDIVQQGGCCQDTLLVNPDNQLVSNNKNPGYRHHEHRSVHFNKQEDSKDQASHALDSMQHKSSYSHDKKKRTEKYLQQAEPVASTFDTRGHLYCQGVLPSTNEKLANKRMDSISDVNPLENSALLHKEEVESSSCLQETQRASECKPSVIDAEQHAPKAWGSVYKDDMRSQSCIDLGSLVPADILQEDEVLEKNGKIEEEKKRGFFSRFSLFSKKKTYKVNISSSEDFKYDPDTKKWTGSSSTHESSSFPIPVKKETPKPVMVNTKKIGIALDGSIKSRYTNNVNVEGEKSSLASLLPKKK